MGLGWLWRFVALCVVLVGVSAGGVSAQSFGSSQLDFDGFGGVSLGTSLMFGPDGRLYVSQIDGTLDVLTIQRNGPDDYHVVAAEEVLDVRNIPNHNDDGSASSSTNRETTGIAVAGTATNPIIYASSSDIRVGGPSGDQNLDTNSGVITRISWQGIDLDDPSGFWDAVDLVRGLPRSEENHATNGLEFVTVGSNDYLIVAQGGHTNAGSPSTNFAWLTEYALSAAVLAINLTQLEGMPVLTDGGRKYVYDLPTLDDPTRANANGITDPGNSEYNGIDVDDPWGGNDGLNQAKLVPGGPVQIFSPGYRNAYDLVVTESGAVYVTDNGANGGWGGYPENEGLGGNANNDYRPGEPGSNEADAAHDDAQVNNIDHLTLVTQDINAYVFGSFYGGHPTPVRSNPSGAGLFTRGSSHSSDPGDSNNNGFTDDWFRTLPFDPSSSGDAANTQRALPADWPPVPFALANPIEGDYRQPGGNNPDGPNDALVTTWPTNTNGIDEYTASNFGGAMQGDLIAGRNAGGNLHRVQLNPDGSLNSLSTDFISGIGGNALGITANGDNDPFPGTIWVATFNSNIVVLEPQDFVICIQPGDPGYDPGDDNDFDGYSNQDEIDNGSDICNGGSAPNDFDKVAGAPLVSDLNDPDDDADGIDDALDATQLGDPTNGGSDAFDLPVTNELFSDNPNLGGYLGLGFTGLMNNGAANPNWLDWLDQIDAGPNPNDILGGAVGAMTMQMNEGTARGVANDQEKGFQYAANVDLATGGFRVHSRMLSFNDGLQLYPFGAGELGFFIGDGSQSNYIQFVVHEDGVEMQQEIEDVPQAPLFAAISTENRPNSTLELELSVESASGQVEALYAIDGGTFSSIGTLVAEGSVLQAIQQTGTPLHVGLIGTSGTVGAEVEGTWDFLNVNGRQPSVALPLPNIDETAGSGPLDIDLDAFFDDDEGDGNLTYTIESISNTAIGANLVGSTLSITFPSFLASAVITVRATDSDGFFVEQSFSVQTSSAATVLYRVNAGGSEIAAIDGDIPWSADTTSNNSPQLETAGSNNQAAFNIASFTSAVDQTTTPLGIYQTERWSSDVMRYAFPVPEPGSYEVRLYMGNGYEGTSAPGQRVFSVTVEGTNHSDLTNLDLSGTYGHLVGTVITHVVQVNDGVLEIDFSLGSADNPLINGIEIVSGSGGGAGQNPIIVEPIPNQNAEVGDIINLPVIASGGDTPASFSFSAAGLPAGLQIEPTTGLIFGTLEASAASPSAYVVSVTVDDNDASSTDAQTIFFDITVAGTFWIDLDEDLNYTARHECSFVQAGDQFYLFGGRENAQTLDTYDYGSDSWSTSAPAPIPFNHFQATEYQGLVWVIGAFQTNDFPNEVPASSVYAFDPANDVWLEGPSIPPARRRGSAGLVVYNDKFYAVGGNTIGHNGGFVPWFDEFDPQTGTWTPLADAPRARDHFHAAVADDKLYVIGGRLSGGVGGTFAPLIPEVDVYDFTSGSWSTLPAASDLPTPRAAASVALFNGDILVIGGEGNGQAYDTVEALDPISNDWTTLDSLNHARHGTQAIMSGFGIYVTAGSPQEGSGNQHNMEVYNADLPSGTPSTAGDLLTLPDATVSAGGTLVSLDHVGGNQGIFVESIEVSGLDAADFTLTTPVGEPFVIPIAGSRDVGLTYAGSDPTPSATLDITYSGGQTRSVNLLPEPGTVTSLVAGALALSRLRKRRRPARSTD